MAAILDSSVWFDYFLGKPWAKKFKSLVDSNETILISSVNLIEVYSKYLLKNPDEAEEKKNFMLSRCKLVEVNKEIALEASELKSKHSLALADSIILATARLNNAKVLTFDSDFIGLQGVEVIKRR